MRLDKDHKLISGNGLIIRDILKTCTQRTLMHDMIDQYIEAKGGLPDLPEWSFTEIKNGVRTRIHSYISDAIVTRHDRDIPAFLVVSTKDDTQKEYKLVEYVTLHEWKRWITQRQKEERRRANRFQELQDNLRYFRDLVDGQIRDHDKVLDYIVDEKMAA